MVGTINHTSFKKIWILISIFLFLFFLIQSAFVEDWSGKVYRFPTKFQKNFGPSLQGNYNLIHFVDGPLEDTVPKEYPIHYIRSKLHYETDTIKTNLRCMNNLNESSANIWSSAATNYYKNVEPAFRRIDSDCAKMNIFKNLSKFLKPDYDFTSKKSKHNYIFNIDKFKELKNSSFNLNVVPFFRKTGNDYQIGFLPSVLSLNESTKNIAGALHIDHEFFEIQLHLKYNQTYEKVYTEVYYNWQTSNMAESMQKKRYEINNTISHLPYNVLILGVDSLSSQHMQRLLPKSFKYATENMSFDFFRNSQVAGGNTYPNLMALLSGVMELNITTYTSKGQVVEEHDDRYFKNESGYYDMLPFTWKLLPEYYTSVMIEDYYEIAMFNYLKRGFAYPPTDVYMRPYFIQVERNAKQLKQSTVCDWALLFYELIDDYLEYIEREFYLDARNKILLPFYFLSFHKKCSHDMNLMVTAIDEKLLRIVKRLNQPIYLKNTLILIYGDHGSRLDAFTFSKEGTIEKGKSTMLLRLPDDFREKRSIFKVNKDRFITPFDIHRTILHFLQNEFHNQEKLDFFSIHEKLYTDMMHLARPSWKNITLTQLIMQNRLRPLRLRGVDMFEEIIPWNRSCTEATSTNLYCSCNYFTTQQVHKTPTETDLQTKDKQLLQYVKKDFFGSIFPSYQNHRNICQHLEISEFTTLMINRINNTDKREDDKFYLDQITEINTRVQVNKNSGQFQLSYVIEEWFFAHHDYINHIFSQIYHLKHGLLSLFSIHGPEFSNSDKYLYWREGSKLFTLRRAAQFIRLDKYALTNGCLNSTLKYLEKICICIK